MALEILENTKALVALHATGHVPVVCCTTKKGIMDTLQLMSILTKAMQSNFFVAGYTVVFEDPECQCLHSIDIRTDHDEGLVIFAPGLRTVVNTNNCGVHRG